MSHLPRHDHPATRGARAQARAERRKAVRRNLGLTALGTLLPGAGLSLGGRRKLGLALLGLFVLGIVAVAVYISRNGLVKTALNLAVRPNLLMALSVAVVVGALVWAVSIAFTSKVTRPPLLTSLQKILTTSFAAVMCLVIVAPSVQLVRYMNIQRDVVDTLFASTEHVAPSAAGVIAAKPQVAKADPWAKTPRVNVLLLGSDSGKGREGTRTDSMMIASINTRTGDTVLFGVPRNLERIPFPSHDPLHRVYPDGWNCGSQCLMNAVWTLAEGRRDLFPGDNNPGLTATRDALSAVLGLQIDRTVIIDLSGFQSLVDAMGGVDVTIQEQIPIGGEVKNGQVVGITGWLYPGRQHLNGYKALWYSRSRATTDDFSRMRRQRCMVGALIGQVNPVSMLDKFPVLAKVAKNNIRIDLSQEELPAWVELVERIQKGQIRSLPFTTKNINVVRPDYGRIHAMVREAIAVKAAGKPSTGTASKTGAPTPGKTTTSGSTTRTTPTPTSTAAQNDELVNIAEAC